MWPERPYYGHELTKGEYDPSTHTLTVPDDKGSSFVRFYPGDGPNRKKRRAELKFRKRQLKKLNRK